MLETSQKHLKSHVFKEQIVLIDSDASVVVRFVDVNNVWTSHNYLLSHWCHMKKSNFAEFRSSRIPFKGSSKAFEINLLSKFLCSWNIKVILMFINFFFFFSDGLESKTSSSQIFYSRKVGFLYIILLWNSRNREHQKYLWNVIVLGEIRQ